MNIYILCTFVTLDFNMNLFAIVYFPFIFPVRHFRPLITKNLIKNNIKKENSRHWWTKKPKFKNMQLNITISIYSNIFFYSWINVLWEFIVHFSHFGQVSNHKSQEKHKLNTTQFLGSNFNMYQTYKEEKILVAPKICQFLETWGNSKKVLELNLFNY